MLGNVLKLIRIANEDIAVREVANKIGISQTHISNIEVGKSNTSLKILRKLSEIYNIPMSEIVRIDEIQEENNLNYQETLRLILMYYIDKENYEKETEKHR